MFKRILAIAFILVCTSIAWAVLGSTIFYRWAEKFVARSAQG